MNAEPKEEEIPIEFEDLLAEVQEAIIVYNMLQDNIDSMSGVYLGKYYSGINDIFEIMEIEDRNTCYKILQIIDKQRSDIINKKSKEKAAKKT